MERMSGKMKIVLYVLGLGCGVGEGCNQPGSIDEEENVSSQDICDGQFCRIYKVCGIFVYRKAVPTLVPLGELYV